MFRARFGTERNGESLLAEGVYSKNSEIKDGYPEFSFGMLRKLGWDKHLTGEELKAIAEVAGYAPQGSNPKEIVLKEPVPASVDHVNWKTDLSGGIQRVAIKHGCAPFGNARARCVVWDFPDPVPIHREPLYTPRFDLVAKYPTYEDRKSFWRLPTLYRSIQKDDHSKKYPLVFISGRLTEHQGGGAATRSNPWLAKLQPEMFLEINPVDANNVGVRYWQYVWLEGAEGGRNRIAEGKLPLCAEMCATKSLLAGDGDIVSEIYRQRVMMRGGSIDFWRWQTAYPAGQTKGEAK